MFKSAIAFSPRAQKGTFVRFAEEDDLETILSFLYGLARSENISEDMVADADDLAENLFGRDPYAECLIAEVDGIPAGFALFFHSFSPFVGKPNLVLQSLYVPPEQKQSDSGIKLMRELASIALERDCAAMEWAALDLAVQTVSIGQNLGLPSLSNRVTHRLGRSEIEALASALSK